MIRVLIADDEKIVRMGLVSCMPWAEFGMVVAGEANNGENALRFMETNEIDLLFTDLSMPVMSGIELMREVTLRFPHVKIVVLTLHQDFEYIQEALRLGAIDYVSKTQLEKENFHDVLGRISEIMKKKELTGLAISKESLVKKSGLVLYCMKSAGEPADYDFPLKGAAETDFGVWYWNDYTQQDLAGLTEWAKNRMTAGESWAVVCISGFEKMDKRQWLQLIRSYKKMDLFYTFDPSNPYIYVRADTISLDNETSLYKLDDVKEKWLTGDWINNEEYFMLLKEELKGLRLPPIRLTRMIYSMTDEWNRIYKEILPQPIETDDFLTSWHQLEEWLSQVRVMIKGISDTPAFSAEIQESIRKALVLMQELLSDSLSAGDVARLVNMSSSYFSICFKEIVGKTYSEHLRDLRMKRAKELVRTTSKPIHWIAEQVGYQDEKYFSRLFRDQTGCLPSEYRQRNRRVKVE
ncbi:response regulator [Metabacillus indicus]|uniref:response regulator transcription factor n=1 Tax=Metabacillus indicus TaxID=246786 RepID=UPI00049305AF|nr:response regulator [Metabacillus indicus]KEZ52460.1 chemotaxis protein CheY [Metabacillus indicus LMG 22858]